MIGFGLVGCGRISDRHIHSLASCEGGRLTAVCDVDPNRTAQAAASYRELAASSDPIREYANIADLLADPSVEAVVIATHSASHADLAEAALTSGKHVILEKPMALSLADADRLIRAAESRSLILQVCHQLRYRPAFRKLKEAVDAGALGRIYMGVVSIRLHRPESYYQAARWRGTWEHDGGMLLNQGIHLIDLLGWYMGSPRQTYGALLRGIQVKETEDLAAAVVHFDDGVGVIEANTVTRPNNLDNCLTLFGEKGTVSIGGVQLQEIRRWSLEDPAHAAPTADSDEHKAMYENFIQAMEGQPAMLITGKEGKAALEFIFSIYDSFKTGQIRTGVPADFSASDMADAERWP